MPITKLGTLEKKFDEIFTELADKEVYNADNIGILFHQVKQLQRLIVVMCADRGEFIDEPHVLRHNLSKRMKEILTFLPSVSKSMKDE